MDFENKKCIWLLMFAFISLLFVFFILLNHYNCHYQVEIDLINERMQAHNLHVDNAIHLLEYQIQQINQIANAYINNLEIGIDLLANTKYTTKYNANL